MYVVAGGRCSILEVVPLYKFVRCPHWCDCAQYTRVMSALNHCICNCGESTFVFDASGVTIVHLPTAVYVTVNQKCTCRSAIKRRGGGSSPLPLVPFHSPFPPFSAVRNISL